MGMGDDIMATAWARVGHACVGQPVSLGYESPMFEGNPHINVAGPRLHGHSPGKRPYIIGRTERGFIFNPNHRAVKGTIYLTDEERAAAREARELLDEFILIEPHVKGTVSQSNKDWGWQNWCDLVDALSGFNLVQLDYGKELLPEVSSIGSPNFRMACAYLEQASMFVGTDGGLHHAAAALDTPAVVVWGGYSTPEILGYPFQKNIYHGNGGCGSLVECAHCREEMDAIAVEEVDLAIKEKLIARVPEEETPTRH